MYCIICGEEIDDQQFRNTCETCEKEVNKLSRKMLKSRKKINFPLLKNKFKRKSQRYAKG